MSAEIKSPNGELKKFSKLKREFLPCLATYGILPLFTLIPEFVNNGFQVDPEKATLVATMYSLTFASGCRARHTGTFAILTAIALLLILIGRKPDSKLSASDLRLIAFIIIGLFLISHIFRSWNNYIRKNLPCEAFWTDRRD